MLKVKESVRGSSAFSRDPPGLPYATPDPAALVKLMEYATSHTKTQGAGLLTILAYDGHGVDQDDCGSSAVHQIEDGRLVNLGPPPSPKVSMFSKPRCLPGSVEVFTPAVSRDNS